VLDVMESVDWHAALDMFDVLGVEQCLVFGVESVGALRLSAESRPILCALRLGQYGGRTAYAALVRQASQ
jgi:hypothetical protein